MTESFHIRPASNALEDGKRILEFVDSQLEWLANMGSEEQWGLEPLGTDERTQEGFRQIISWSEEANRGQPFERLWTKAFVAEVHIPLESMTPELEALVSPPETSDPKDFRRLRVASTFVDGKSVDYARELLPEQDDEDPFLFISHLVTDRRVPQWSTSAGNALLEHVKKEALSMGLKRICLDCWNGNGGKLVKYYEARGFRPLGLVWKHEEKDWPAAVLELRL